MRWNRGLTLCLTLSMVTGCADLLGIREREASRADATGGSDAEVDSAPELVDARGPDSNLGEVAPTDSGVASVGDGAEDGDVRTEVDSTDGGSYDAAELDGQQDATAVADTEFELDAALDGDAASSADAASDGEPAIDGAIASVRWPEPNGTDSKLFKPDTYGLTFAMRDVLFFEPTVGFDLDGVATMTLSSPRSCVSPGPPNLDQAGGIDNAGAVASRILLAGKTVSDEDNNRRILAGEGTILLRVYGYGGAANQNDGTLWAGLVRGTRFQSPDGAQIPKWDGEDRWYADSADLTLGFYVPMVSTTFAYVSDYTLVLRFSEEIELRVRTGVGPLLIRLKDTVITAKLVPTSVGPITAATTFRLDAGVGGGRWPADHALHHLGGLASPTGGRICDNPLLLGVLKNKVCNARDLGADPFVVDPRVPCTHVSEGFQFRAVAAQFAGTESVAQPSVCATLTCD